MPRMVRVIVCPTAERIGEFALGHDLLDVKEPAVSVIVGTIDQDRVEAGPAGYFDRKRQGIGHTNQVVALERLHVDFPQVALSPCRNAVAVGKDMHFISLHHRRNDDFIACRASGNRRDAVKNSVVTPAKRARGLSPPATTSDEPQPIFCEIEWVASLANSPGQLDLRAFVGKAS